MPAISMAVAGVAALGATGIGLGLTAIGTATAVGGAVANSYAQKQALAAQQQAEDQRKKAMELDADRRRRQEIRAAIAARAQSLSTATNQGASAEGASALPGAYGGISGQSNTNILGINQNQQIGESIFAANAAANSAYRSAATAQSWTSAGNGLSSLGGAMMTNGDTINKVGQTWFGSKKNEWPVYGPGY